MILCISVCRFRDSKVNWSKYIVGKILRANNWSCFDCENGERRTHNLVKEEVRVLLCRQENCVIKWGTWLCCGKIRVWRLLFCGERRKVASCCVQDQWTCYVLGKEFSGCVYWRKQEEGWVQRNENRGKEKCCMTPRRR